MEEGENGGGILSSGRKEVLWTLKASAKGSRGSGSLSRSGAPSPGAILCEKGDSDQCRSPASWDSNVLTPTDQGSPPRSGSEGAPRPLLDWGRGPSACLLALSGLGGGSSCLDNRSCGSQRGQSAGGR